MKHVLTFVANEKKIDVYQIELNDDIHYDPIGNRKHMQHVIVTSHFLKSHKFVIAVNKLFRFII